MNNVEEDWEFAQEIIDSINDTKVKLHLEDCFFKNDDIKINIFINDTDKPKKSKSDIAIILVKNNVGASFYVINDNYCDSFQQLLVRKLSIMHYSGEGDFEKEKKIIKHFKKKQKIETRTRRNSLIENIFNKTTKNFFNSIKRTFSFKGRNK